MRKRKPSERRIAQGRENAAGFTMLEVLVALAILGTGLFILLQHHFASLSLLIEAQEQTLMRVLVRQVVAEAEREVLLGNDEGEGDFGDRYEGYRYTFSAKPFNEEDAPGLFEVTAKVTGPLDERELSFYIFDGTQIENDENRRSST